MAEVVKSIQSSGGDYATLAAWEAAIPADQALADPWVAQFDEVMDGGIVTINVSNANSAPHKITAASGYRFNDGASWPAFNPGEGARIVNDNSGNNVLVETPAIIIEWVEIDGAGHPRNGIRVNTGGSTCTARYLLMHDSQYCLRAFSGDLLAHNCMVWPNRGTDSNGATVINSGPTLTVYNCTFYAATTYGVVQSAGTLNAYNNISVGSGSADYSGTIGGDYNLSSDTSAPGTTNWQSVAASTILESVTASSEDLHLKSSVNGTYEGGDYSGTIGSLDIDGDTRSDWDIGADEIAAVAGATIPRGLSRLSSVYGPIIGQITLEGI